jgi:hypothetical protein
MAYIKTMSGKEWHSNVVRFITKGTLLEFSPLNSFSLSVEGGELSTGVVVGDDARWEVVSAPSWCTVHYSDTDIRVSANKSTKERSGEIVVETTSPYGEKQSKTLPVTQKSLSWDGTVWSMQYSFHLVSASGDEHFNWENDIPGSISSTFYVENAAAGSYIDTGVSFGSMKKVSDTVLSFHNSQSEEHEIQVDEEETVKVKINRDVSVTFTRTDATHVKVSGTLSASASGAASGSAKVNISGSGTLMGETKGTDWGSVVSAAIPSFPGVKIVQMP